MGTERRGLAGAGGFGGIVGVDTGRRSWWSRGQWGREDWRWRGAAGGGGPAGEVRAIGGAWGWMGVGGMKGAGRRSGAVWGRRGRGGVGADGGGGVDGGRGLERSSAVSRVGGRARRAGVDGGRRPERPFAAAALSPWFRGSAAAVLSRWIGDQGVMRGSRIPGL